MPTYAYVARDKAGKKTTGFVFSKDEDGLADSLSQNGLVLISANTEKEDLGKHGIKLNLKAVLTFTINLAALINGGLPLLHSLNMLARDSKDDEVADLVTSLRDYIEAGGTLQDALSLHPKTFSQEYIAIVVSGEKTGKLGSVLDDMATYLEWYMDLKAKIKELATYPIIVGVFMIGVVIILVGFVLPKFEPILLNMGVDLPLPTKIVLGTSRFFIQMWYVIVTAIILLIAGIKLLLRNQAIAFSFDAMKLILPIVGNLIYKIILSRFSRLMYLTLSSGITVIEALQLGEAVVPNRPLSAAILKTRKSVSTGSELTASLKASNMFPKMLIRMVGIGEQSGSIASGFEKVCHFYDKETPRTIRTIFAILEPLLIALMGVMIGGIALAVFLPLVKMTQAL